MWLLAFIKSLFTRSSKQAHLPQAPMPPGYMGQPFSQPSDFQQVERHYSRELIVGTSIAAGWQEEAVLIDGQLVEGRDTFHIQLGCGHLVARLQSTSDGRNMQPGVGGTCPFCQLELAKPLEKGEITPPDAERLSLFCGACESWCDSCGRRSLCARHGLPFQVDEGLVRLCPECRQAAEKQKFFKQVVRGILSPFTEDDGA